LLTVLTADRAREKTGQAPCLEQTSLAKLMLRVAWKSFDGDLGGQTKRAVVGTGAEKRQNLLLNLLNLIRGPLVHFLLLQQPCLIEARVVA